MLEVSNQTPRLQVTPSDTNSQGLEEGQEQPFVPHQAKYIQYMVTAEP